MVVGRYASKTIGEDMAEFVDSTVKEIDVRLGELREEATRLEAAREALLGGRRRRARASASATATRRGRGARGSARPARGSGRPSTRRDGNTRANQALALVRSRPGITIPEMAKEMGIEPNYLYRVLPRLVERGQVARQGQGWHPASSAS
jgi:uncharacterized small protein (DUF1192 family)